jgi:hypothetical protein
MDRAALRLPIRLLPRKGMQLGRIAVSCVFLGFSLFWMAGASGILDLDGWAFRIPPPGGWPAGAVALFGLPFAAIGIAGIAGAVLRMLPGSPHYHLEIDAEGLVLRSLLKERRHAWRDLPAFETLEHKRRTKSGASSSWYAVAMEAAPPEAGEEPGATYAHEVLRIDADGYGANSGQQDAADLAAWFNHLGALARDRQLAADELVEVPPGFAGNAIAVPAPRAGRADRTPTVVRR